MRRRSRALPLLVLAACAAPGGPGATSRSTSGPRLVVAPQVAPAAGPGACGPNWAAGAALASWTEGDAAGATLFTADYADGAFGPPRVVQSGAPWFVNWADVPHTAVRGARRVASWLVSRPEGGYAYDVRVAASRDAGASWEQLGAAHRDDSAVEHGFVSFVVLEDGAFDFALTWLDGRETLAGGATGLWFASLDSSARRFVEERLDARVCDCCQTSCVATADGTLVVAYRDRSDDEVRDVSIVRRAAGSADWSRPRRVHADEWKITGCPVNGPALATRGNSVACVWFTLLGGAKPRVFLARSNDAGEAFGLPLRIDDGLALGRVGIAALEGGWLVSWLEKVGAGAEWRARFVPDAGGEPTPSVRLAAVSGGRSDGFLRLAGVLPRTAVALWRGPHGLASARLVLRSSRARPRRGESAVGPSKPSRAFPGALPIAQGTTSRPEFAFSRGATRD